MTDKIIVVKQEVRYDTNGGFDPVTARVGRAEVFVCDTSPPRPLSDYTDEELLNGYVDSVIEPDSYYRKVNIYEAHAEILKRMEGRLGWQ